MADHHREYATEVKEDVLYLFILYSVIFLNRLRLDFSFLLGQIT